MSDAMKPLSCDPVRVRGMSEKLIVSHYENNYGGAVKRLNLIDEQLADLDYAKGPGFPHQRSSRATDRDELDDSARAVLRRTWRRGRTGRAAKRRHRPCFRLVRALALGIRRHGQGAGGGSGWVHLINGAADHCHTLAGGTAILALDMYEHPHRLRRQGYDVCRRLHDRDPLGKRRSIVRRTRALDGFPRMGSFAADTPIGRRCIGVCGDGNCSPPQLIGGNSRMTASASRPHARLSRDAPPTTTMQRSENLQHAG
jgi:Fe-Mn family superoxide dismutase